MSKTNYQTPPTNNPISNEKGTLPRTRDTLPSWTAGSFNAGHNHTAQYARIMAGQEIHGIEWNVDFKLLTPLTPTYQALKGFIDVYFVPDDAVWDNARAFEAQRTSTTENIPDKMPDIGNIQIPRYARQVGSTNNYILITNLINWRDSFISRYIPRIGTSLEGNMETVPQIHYPKYNVLPLRAEVAIWNKYLRDKRYENKKTEYKGDTVTTYEFDNYMPGNASQLLSNIDYYYQRSKRPNSYWNDYRTVFQGIEAPLPDNENENYEEDNALLNWLMWENIAPESRYEAELQGLTDEEAIVKTRGSKLLTEKEAQHLERKEFVFNYNSVTQNTYNVNNDINPNFQMLGQQGAYSYTNLKVNLLTRGIQFAMSGTLIIKVTAYADTVYEQGLERTMLNINKEDVYRPEMKGQKEDVLYMAELGTEYIQKQQDYEKTIGYKRKWSELFRWPNVVGGDLCTNDWLGEYSINGTNTYELRRVTTQKTYQFFDNNPEYFFPDASTPRALNKKIYKDYSDIYLNKNQAAMNEWTIYNENNYYLSGENQIYYLGHIKADTTLPVNSDIVNNYTMWGEH